MLLQSLHTTLVESWQINRRKEGRRETTYVVSFLSCWYCGFVLLENEDRLIKLGTFKVIVLMARGETFSLVIPVLATIYQGLNVI
ncbi:Vitamin K-dependent protein C [Bienertia sinuspersici]